MDNNLTLSLTTSLLAFSIIKAIIHNPSHTLAIIAVLCATLAGPTFSNYRHFVKITGMDLGMILVITNQSTLLDLYLHYTPNYNFDKTNCWGENIAALARRTPYTPCLPVIAAYDSSNLQPTHETNKKP